MNRKLLVNLLQKNIDELSMITEGFMEMTEYPKAIIVLARRKTEDIQLLIDELAETTPAQLPAFEKQNLDTLLVEKDEKPNEFVNDNDSLPEVTPVSLTEIMVETEPEMREEFDLEEIVTAQVEIENAKQIVENIADYKLDHLLDIEQKPTPTVEEIIEQTETFGAADDQNLASKNQDFEDNAGITTSEEVEIIELPTLEIHEQPVPQAPVHVPTLPISETETNIYTETFKVSETMHNDTKSQTIVVTEENKRTIIAEKITPPTVSRNEAHQKADNSLSASLANKKVSDIKQAISIGDRFRFQRELFRGNGEEMNKTLTYLNQLATLKEAQAFLESKYNWAKDNEAADDFYQVLKRKY